MRLQQPAQRGQHRQLGSPGAVAVKVQDQPALRLVQEGVRLQRPAARLLPPLCRLAQQPGLALAVGAPAVQQGVDQYRPADLVCRAAICGSGSVWGVAATAPAARQSIRSDAEEWQCHVQ